MPNLVDTWGWLALGHRRDQHHQQVLEIFQNLRSTKVLIHTSDYVLDEVITLLFKREVFQEAVNFMEGVYAATKLRQVVIHPITSELFQKTWQLRLKYQDKPRISFTDLTSMIVMQEQGIQSILTMDDHFIQIGMGFQKIL
ncbi:MAG: PIN domain-containing protein [Acaryochloridaceae cyanobacterium RU_4_10]|nr:PIN domain-containing protein [Acaryochloridaceae cyanobacterium RU_4_10]